MTKPRLAAVKVAKEEEDEEVEHRLAAARELYELPPPFIAVLSKMSFNDRELVLSTLNRIATMSKEATGSIAEVSHAATEANRLIAEQNRLIAENTTAEIAKVANIAVTGIKDIVLAVINSSSTQPVKETTIRNDSQLPPANMGQHVHPPTAETVTKSDSVQQNQNGSVFEQEPNTWGQAIASLVDTTPNDTKHELVLAVLDRYATLAEKVIANHRHINETTTAASRRIAEANSAGTQTTIQEMSKVMDAATSTSKSIILALINSFQQPVHESTTTINTSSSAQPRLAAEEKAAKERASELDKLTSMFEIVFFGINTVLSTTEKAIAHHMAIAGANHSATTQASQANIACTQANQTASREITKVMHIASFRTAELAELFLAFINSSQRKPVQESTTITINTTTAQPRQAAEKATREVAAALEAAEKEEEEEHLAASAREFELLKPAFLAKISTISPTKRNLVLAVLDRNTTLAEKGVANHRAIIETTTASIQATADKASEEQRAVALATSQDSASVVKSAHSANKEIMLAVINSPTFEDEEDGKPTAQPAIPEADDRQPREAAAAREAAGKEVEESLAASAREIELLTPAFLAKLATMSPNKQNLVLAVLDRNTTLAEKGVEASRAIAEANQATAEKACAALRAVAVGTSQDSTSVGKSALSANTEIMLALINTTFAANEQEEEDSKPPASTPIARAMSGDPPTLQLACTARASIASFPHPVPKAAAHQPNSWGEVFAAQKQGIERNQQNGEYASGLTRAAPAQSQVSSTATNVAASGRKRKAEDGVFSASKEMKGIPPPPAVYVPDSRFAPTPENCKFSMGSSGKKHSTFNGFS